MPKLIDIMSEFWKRTLSGALYVAVIIGSIVWQAGFVWLLLSAGLAFWAVYEYNKLTHPRCLLDIYSELAAFAMPFAVSYYAYAHSLLIAGIYGALLMACIIVELWDKNGNPLINWGNLLTGQVMIALPFALMNVLCFINPYLLLAVFVLIWVNDTFAYCVGVSTAKMPGGNHKMFPRVSPKKSWEGLFGGMACTIGAAFILNRFGWFDTITKDGFELLTAGTFGMIVSVFGTLGDLVESLMKRTVGVKDSGKFLPGHGGVLDRFDSTLLAAPTALLFVLMMMAC